MKPKIPASDNGLFNSFTKRSEIDFVREGNQCVIYTRVSSKEQMERLSLETQLRECSEYAIKQKLSVVATFGGTYESAKSDERKEFKRMFAHVQKNKNISSVIVYSLDRFSRTGKNALDLSDQLRKLGVKITAITQPVDASNPSGMMMQDILFLFAKHDNDQRKMKTIAGIREHLLRWEWCNRLPKGYKKQFVENGASEIVLDEKYAPLIVRAFEMKAYDNLTDVEIRKRLIALGWVTYLSEKRLNEMFRNPFYCGKISSTILPDQIVQGKHPALIPEDLFLRVHGIKTKTPHGWKHRKADDSIPFSSFVKCAKCGWTFVGYKKDKQTADGLKSYYYYKCNKKGCKCNIRAEKLHKGFTDILNAFVFDERLIEPLRYAMNAEIEKLTKTDKDELKILRDQLADAEKEWKTIRQRFALGKIDESLYMENEPELRGKVAKIQNQIEIGSTDYSNFCKYVDQYLDFALKLPSLWALADCSNKEQLQNFVFPEGIYYDTENSEYRTKTVNPVFAFISGFSGNCEQKNGGFLVFNNEKSASVARTRIELVFTE
jgi:site-specific DNA recombinase